MIANAAVMMLLMQENQRRGGWGRDPNERDNGALLLIIAISVFTAAFIVRVFG